MLILFTRDHKYNETIYHKGQVYDIPEENGIALRWLKRGGIEVKQATEVLKEEILEEVSEPITLQANDIVEEKLTEDEVINLVVEDEKVSNTKKRKSKK